MTQEKLFETVLIEPLSHSCDELHIVSGYSHPTMATRHYEEIDRMEKKVHVNLIIGMCQADGILRNDHDLFRELVAEHYPTYFNCRYVTKGKPVHSKVYVWMKEKQPVVAFVGSANYSQSGFFRLEETMTTCDPALAYTYFKTVLSNSTDCREDEVENKIRLLEEMPVRRRVLHPATGQVESTIDLTLASGLPTRRVSLLLRDGTMATRSGLNWGMRPERSYSPEAYISLRPDVYRSDFFPPRGQHFTVLVDNKLIPIVCSRGQKDEATAISTPNNNTEFGRYFRAKLGIGEHEPVTKEALERYGKTYVDFYKLNEDEYLMVF